MLEYLLLLAVAAAIGGLLSRAGRRLIAGGLNPFAVLIAGWRDEPWPRGMQEEDDDRAWGTRQPGPPSVLVPVVATIEHTIGTVQTDRLRPRTRAR